MDLIQLFAQPFDIVVNITRELDLSHVFVTCSGYFIYRFLLFPKLFSEPKD